MKYKVILFDADDTLFDFKVENFKFIRSFRLLILKLFIYVQFRV